MKTLILMLCIAIGFVLVVDPRHEKAPAQQDANKQSPTVFDALESMNDTMRDITDIVERIDERSTAHSKEIESVEQCVATEVEQLKTRLIAVETKAESPPSPVKSDGNGECNCDCDCKDRKHEERIAALEARVGMYPTVSSATGYGSTGTPMVSGGSTGIVSYGSAGGTSERLQSTRTPLRTVANVVTAPLRSSMTREQMLDLHDAMHEGDGIDRPGHWSYPGDIASHLQGHQDNRVQPGVVAYPASTPRNVTYSTSDCPGGNCPTSYGRSSVSSSGNGWWLGKALGVRR